MKRLKAVDELVHQEGAFAQGLFAEGAEPLGNLAEAGDEFGLIAALDEVEVLLERLDEVLQQGLAFGGGGDDLGVERTLMSAWVS